MSDWTRDVRAAHEATYAYRRALPAGPYWVCPACRRRVAPTAPSCPSCGFIPRERPLLRRADRGRWRWWWRLSGLFVIRWLWRRGALGKVGALIAGPIWAFILLLILAIPAAGMGDAGQRPGRTLHLRVPLATRSSPVHRASAAPSGGFLDTETGMSARIRSPHVVTSSGEFIPLDPGKEFLIFFATVSNGGSENHEYGSLDFDAVTPDGETFSCDPLIPPRFDPTLPGGEMEPGDRRAGWLGCQIPRDVRSATITWDDDFNLEPPARLALIAMR